MAPPNKNEIANKLQQYQQYRERKNTLPAFNGSNLVLLSTLRDVGELDPSLAKLAAVLIATDDALHHVVKDALRGSPNYQHLKHMGITLRKSADQCRAIAQHWKENGHKVLDAPDIDELLDKMADKLSRELFQEVREKNFRKSGRTPPSTKEVAEKVGDILSAQDPIARESEVEGHLEDGMLILKDTWKADMWDCLRSASKKLEERAVAYTHLAEVYDRDVLPLVKNVRGGGKRGGGHSSPG